MVTTAACEGAALSRAPCTSDGRLHSGGSSSFDTCIDVLQLPSLSVPTLSDVAPCELLIISCCPVCVLPSVQLCCVSADREHSTLISRRCSAASSCSGTEDSASSSTSREGGGRAHRARAAAKRWSCVWRFKENRRWKGFKYEKRDQGPCKQCACSGQALELGVSV
mgnify:CR=1 FL=1